MDSLSKLSEVVGSEEIVTLDSFLFLITGSPLNENKNEHTSNLTYMVYQLKHRIVELERQLQISKNTTKVTIKHHRIWVIHYIQCIYTQGIRMFSKNRFAVYCFCRINILWVGNGLIIRIRKFIKSPWKIGPSRKLSIKEELLMVLMKLRLGLINEDLFDRFGPTTSVV
jgi:hypothetical protein